MDKDLKKYYSLLKEHKLLGGTISLLQWDQETKMPHKGTENRSDQLALMSKILHEKSTNKEYVKAVNTLFDKQEDLDPIDRRSVEVSKRELDRSIKLPAEFVEEYSKIRSLAHKAWVTAKKENDFSIFKPSLSKIIGLTKQYADYIDAGTETYDVLLDDYEEGMKSEDVTEIFSKLKIDLKELIEEVSNQEEKDANAFGSIEYDDDNVERVVIKMLETIGFDFDKGTIGRVHHPFETTLAAIDDVRVNMSYYHKDFASTVTGAIHELGHGLYEQNIDEKYKHTSFSHGVSLGVHESQSRLLENMIGRSRAFWEYFVPVIEEYFSDRVNTSISLDIDKIMNQINYVSPSFIRIEADEVTYNMHIIIRYEVELEMLKPGFNIDELPELWNSKYKELLGIEPNSLSAGVLQDVHWSMGSIGYFPTYSLGNILAGQLWEKFTSDHKDYDSKIRSGDFSQYFEWFKTNVWAHGGFYKPKDLVKNILGTDMNSESLLNYLKKKYI